MTKEQILQEELDTFQQRLNSTINEVKGFIRRELGTDKPVDDDLHDNLGLYKFVKSFVLYVLPDNVHFKCGDLIKTREGGAFLSSGGVFFSIPEEQRKVLWDSIEPYS